MALEWGPFFLTCPTGAAVLAQSLPSTQPQPNLGLLEPNELCWHHPDDSLRPYPTTKVTRHLAGGV